MNNLVDLILNNESEINKTLKNGGEITIKQNKNEQIDLYLKEYKTYKKIK